MRFAPKLVFDCSYDEHMTLHESKDAGRQLSYCFGDNRRHVRPFDLHMCNIDRNGPTMKALHRNIPTLYDDAFPLNLHEKCFTEHFPKENLVYLTPHCNEVLEEYNPKDVYIIGSYVDKSFSEPISMAKAKQAGIRMARFPIEQYLRWGTSNRSLSIDQVCKIMLDLRYTRDWRKALIHVPRRKLY